MHHLFATLIVLLLLAPAAIAQANKDSVKALLESPEEVLEANIEAIGGRAAWAAVHTLQTEGVRISDGPMGSGKMTATFVESIRYPGYLHNVSEMDTPMGAMTVTRVSTPDASWVEAGPMGRHDLPLVPSLKLASACAELAILNNPDYTLTGLTTDSFEGSAAYVVSVEVGGTTLRRYYDQESLLLLAAERISAGGGEGSEPELVKYRDYREVDGLLISHAQDEEVTMRMISRRGGGEETETQHRGESSVTIENIVINPDVDDALFANE